VDVFHYTSTLRSRRLLRRPLHSLILYLTKTTSEKAPPFVFGAQWQGSCEFTGELIQIEDKYVGTTPVLMEAEDRSEARAKVSYPKPPEFSPDLPKCPGAV
jgi:hypothetical protein